MPFHGSMSNRQSPQISRTLSLFWPILTNLYLDNFDWSFDFQFFQPLSKSLGTVPCAPITTGIPVTLQFLNSLARSKDFSLFSFSLIIIITIIVVAVVNFSYHHQLVVFPWILSDSKSPQISRTFPSIRVDLNNAVIRMVSILPLIIFMFYGFYHQSSSKVFVYNSRSFIFTLYPPE